MQKITTVADLKNAIQQLEYKQANEWPLLKKQFLTTYESLQPLNVIKKSFTELIASLDIKDNLLSTAMGLTAGFLSKAIFVNVSHNPIKKLFGSFLQLIVSNVVSENPGIIKLLAGNMVSFFSKKRESKPTIVDEHSVSLSKDFVLNIR